MTVEEEQQPETYRITVDGDLVRESYQYIEDGSTIKGVVHKTLERGRKSMYYEQRAAMLEKIIIILITANCLLVQELAEKEE